MLSSERANISANICIWLIFWKTLKSYSQQILSLSGHMYRISHRSKKLSIIESTPLLYGQRLQELKLIIAMEFLMILDYFDYYMDTSAKSIICSNYRSLISKSCLLNMLHEIPWFIWFKCNNLAIMTNSAKLRTL